MIFLKSTQKDSGEPPVERSYDEARRPSTLSLITFFSTLGIIFLLMWYFFIKTDWPARSTTTEFQREENVSRVANQIIATPTATATPTPTPPIKPSQQKSEPFKSDFLFSFLNPIKINGSAPLITNQNDFVCSKSITQERGSLPEKNLITTRTVTASVDKISPSTISQTRNPPLPKPTPLPTPTYMPTPAPTPIIQIETTRISTSTLAMVNKQEAEILELKKRITKLEENQNRKPANDNRDQEELKKRVAKAESRAEEAWQHGNTAYNNGVVILDSLNKHGERLSKIETDQKADHDKLENASQTLNQVFGNGDQISLGKISSKNLEAIRKIVAKR